MFWFVFVGHGPLGLNLGKDPLKMVMYHRNFGLPEGI
jgi:hypothetical protein